MTPLAHVTHAAPATGWWPNAVVAGLAALAVAAYLSGMAVTRRRGRTWPVRRGLLWTAGVGLATVGTIGPLADAAREDFSAHMWAHLLTAMAAPVLLVLSAPFTLALRALAVAPARRLARMLRSVPGRAATHPLTGLALTAGGLWLLYATPLLAAAHEQPLLHLALHAHLLFAGFVFTAAIIGIDPHPRRWPRPALAAILLVSMASHAVLAKYLWVNPPPGVPVAQAQPGAELMYYAGGWAEAAVVVIFCAQWYRAAGRLRDRGTASASTGPDDRATDSEQADRGEHPRPHDQERVHPGVLEVDTPAPEA